MLKDVVITASTHHERLVMDFPGQDKRSIFEPNRIVMETAAGDLREDRDNPIAHFAGQRADTPWDDIDVAYFSGEALWTYLTTPFLFAQPGFSINEEPEPWHENGEDWRRLRVAFPDEIASHTREQLFYFGPDGLLRRHDYAVDILGGTTGANYALDYRNVNGIVVPTTRRIYGCEGNHAGRARARARRNRHRGDGLQLRRCDGSSVAPMVGARASRPHHRERLPLWRAVAHVALGKRFEIAQLATRHHQVDRAKYRQDDMPGTVQHPPWRAGTDVNDQAAS